MGYNNLLDLIYPVGSVYLNASNVSPGSLFGGSWTQIQDAFLIGGSSSYPVDSTKRGSINRVPISHSHSTTSNHTHAFGHTHSVGSHSHGYDGGSYGCIYFNNNGYFHVRNIWLDGAWNNYAANTSGTEQEWSTWLDEGSSLYGSTAAASATASSSSGNSTSYCTATASPNTSTNGDSTPGNNMPPYIVVFGWKRVS